jgi:hypothetical protein
MEAVVIYFKGIIRVCDRRYSQNHNNPPSVGLVCPRDVSCNNLMPSVSQIRTKNPIHSNEV